MDENVVIEIWDTFKEYIPGKNKSSAADNYINYVLGTGASYNDLNALIGYDAHLDDAINAIISEEAQTKQPQDDEYDDYDEDNFDPYESDNY